MKVTCPHCGAGFDVADDRATEAGAETTCPECLESVSLDAAASGGGDEFDLSFDLDALSGPGVEIESTGSGLLGEISLEFDGDATSNDLSSPGFGSEVSALQDVDLGIIGTYHRAGRKLQHATDVVWTGQQRAGMPTSPAEPEPPPVVRNTPQPPKTPPPRTQRTPDSVARQNLIDAPTMSAFPSLDDVGGGGVNLPNLDLDIGGAHMGGGPRDVDDDLFEIDAPPLSATAEHSLGGDGNNSMLDEMDFSSLLEDSLGQSKSLFGQDSNPFLDVGLTSESVTNDVAEASVDGLFESDDDTNTFFIEAPSVTADSGVVMPDAAGSFEVSGAFDIDMPDSGGPPTSPPAQKRQQELAPAAISDRTPSRSKPKKSKVGVIAAFGLLAVVIGVGVAAEALGYGWFFMDLAAGDDQSAQTDKPTGPSVPAPVDPLPTEVVAVHQAVPDTPAAYDGALAQLKAKIAASPEDGNAARDWLVLQLRYRYRWPGRYARDDARKAEVATQMDAQRAHGDNQVRFWDGITRAPTKELPRAQSLSQAEVAGSVVSASELPPGRDLLYKAVLARELKKPDNALPLLEHALQAAPNDAWALFEKAGILLSQEKLDDADATLESLMRVAPGHLDGLLMAAKVAVARQTPDAYARARTLSEKAHGSALKANDKYGEYEANLMRAVVYGLQNDLGRRLDALEGAAKFDPRDETLLLELAENDLKSGNAEKAGERFKSCVDGVCSSIRYYRTHIKVLVTSHKLVEAEALTREAESAHPGVPELLFLSGDVLEKRGKLTLAARKYREVKEKDTKYLEAYLRMAGIHRREKEFDEAIRVLDEASKVFEGAGKDSSAAMALLQERGELLVKQGRAEQAREVFGKIVAAQPSNAPARFRLARLLTELGYPQKAVPHFEKLYEQGKSGPEVNITFAEALIRSGKPDRAIEELKIFLQHNPKSLEGLVKLGHAYVQKQRYEEAMAVLEHAVAINQNYGPAYYFAGMAELGRQRQKAEQVERALRDGRVVKEEDKPDFTKAIIALSSAKDKSPEDLGYRESLAEALTESGRERNLLAALEQYDFIIAAYVKAIRLSRPVKREAKVYFSRGLLASKLGRPRSEVLGNFQDALVLDGERADFIARYAEELYRMQVSKKVGGKYVLEAKAYFELVLSQHNPNHVRANYYMGRITLKEWDKQRVKRPGDALHKSALSHFQNVVKHNGATEFPDTLMQIANILRDRETYRLANQYYAQYLDTYRRVYRRDPPNARYVRDLMRRSK